MFKHATLIKFDTANPDIRYEIVASPQGWMLRNSFAQGEALLFDNYKQDGTFSPGSWNVRFFRTPKAAFKTLYRAVSRQLTRNVLG